MSFFNELKRRNVYRVAAAYVVAGWLLTEVLTTVLPTLGAPDWTGRAVVLVFALGFLPTCVLAWVYEFTPDGIRKQSDIDSEEGPAAAPARRPQVLTIGAVVLVVLVLAVLGSQQAGDEQATRVAPVEKSVAVLPFVNMSNNPDNEYFSDGLTETLLHMLAQIPELKVAARTSSFAFKGRNLPIGEIATALGVAHVLEGSVQRVGDNVRITAQLIRASDQFHIWSQSYDRNLDDIFAIQDEIAQQVGSALTESLLGRRDSAGGLSTDSTDAYDLYLQALQHRSTFSFWGLQAEEDLLKGALTVDPDFTAAKVALAFNYQRQAETGRMQGDAALREIDALVAQVLAVSPNDVGARALQGFSHVVKESGAGTADALRAAIGQLQSLVAEHPDAFEPRLLLVRLLMSLRELEQARDVMQAGLQRDPLNPQLLYELATVHLQLEAWDEARSAAERSLELEPRQPNVYTILATLSKQAGDGVAVARHLLDAINADPADYELHAMLADFLYELGLVEQADDFRDRVISIAPTSEVAFRLDMLRAIVTGDDEALAARARDAIAAGTENRRNTVGYAVANLLDVAIRRDSIDEALLFIESHFPGVFDMNSPQHPAVNRSVQIGALNAWYLSLPRDDMVERLLELRRVAEAFGLRLEDDPVSHVDILCLLGEHEQAIAIALERILSQPVLARLGWERRLQYAQYAPLREDPRIRDALRQSAADRAAASERIAAYLDSYAAAE